METVQTTSPFAIPEVDYGFFNSAHFALPVQEVFDFCQNASNVEKVLKDLPFDVDNFLDLRLVKSRQSGDGNFLVLWENKPTAKFKGTLTLMIQEAPMGRGAYVAALAKFDNLDFKDEGPSDLISLFLKRLKSLAETGEIPTTEGQPSGREGHSIH